MSDIKQKARDTLWKAFSDSVFVKSTDSFSGEEVELENTIVDMEAVIVIRGEFDKYAIEEVMDSIIDQAVQEERESMVLKIKNWKAWKLVPDTPRMIMIRGQELDQFLQGLVKDNN